MALARDSSQLRQQTRQLWMGSRYVIGNLECPLTTVRQPVTKQFVFQAAPSYASWLHRLGLTHVSLANNHTLDQHLPGLQATNAALTKAGLGTLGYSADSLAGCRPTLLGTDSSVAVFAYSALHQRLAGEGCLCGRDFTTLCERLAAYKTLFPQRAVLVYLHWGLEYTARPSAAQQAQARQLIDCGAAAVVGAHPHVVQIMEFYRGCPILYSLGNFLFDQQGRSTDLAVQANFEVSHGRVAATYIWPLQIKRALPGPADAPAKAALAARIRQLSPAIQLQNHSATGGWRLLPAASSPTAATGPGYFPRQLVVTDSGNARTKVRLHYLPHAGYYQARLASGGRNTVLPLGFPVYQLTQGDVDNDHHPDLLVGPIKTTHFDSTLRRRLFVYRLADGEAKPRWLGSKVVYRLLYFKAVREKATGHTYVRTIEQEPTGRYCIGRYSWQDFGLMLDQFTARNLSLDAAYNHFIE
jgi:poly-gamma-glutamate synthesis protein (capsule biosynthesis protein)